MQELGKRAKLAQPALASASTAEKNQALCAIAAALREKTRDILDANARDMEKAVSAGMRKSLQDRLRLTVQRISDIADAVEEVAALADPVGEVLGGWVRPNGLRIQRVRTPIGVVAMIYEARPNVTVDAAALCLKTGNVCILRGGKEAIHSNSAFVQVMRQAVVDSGLPADAILLVEDVSRQSALDLMGLVGYVDVLIPRGGQGLIRSVVENARVPVIETGAGNCHVYVDQWADLDMAVSICHNGKTSRPSVCNAVETVLVHEKMAKDFLPKLAKALSSHNVELRGCPQTAVILGEGVVAAAEEDYAAEFGDYILAVRVVDSLEEAVAHIRRYSTGHSEAIVTRDVDSADRFCSQVDSAAVYVNASTRFTDGGEFGFGAEIGISTQKLHARGPMGLAELCSTKYIIRGQGQIR